MISTSLYSVFLSKRGRVVSRIVSVILLCFPACVSAIAQQRPGIEEVYFRRDTINISTYGAKGDGIFLNTMAIDQAIAASNQKGGGIVLIPPGLFLTGPVVLKSNVNLHLKKGAILQLSHRYDDYPLIETNWEGLDAIRCQSPISGIDLENIAITGSGVIDGAGEIWRAVKKNKLTEAAWRKLISSGNGVLNKEKDMWYPTEAAFHGSLAKRPGVIAEGYNIENAKAIKEFLRPNMVSLVRCKKVLLEDVTVQNSPAWCVHPLLSENIILRNLHVRNPWNAQNGDGVDVESCRNVLIDNCSFDVGDDGICLKSGRDEEGRKRGMPTENVTIRNSTVFHGHGGFVIGSEMSGGVRNVWIDNCSFLGTDVGLRFKTARGRGGVVEKIYVSNIRMTDIAGEAILFDMYYMGKDPVVLPGEDDGTPVIEASPVTEATPHFREFHFDNIVCNGAATGILIKGLPEMNVSGIDIKNSFIQSDKGVMILEGDAISLNKVTVITPDKTIVEIRNGKNIVLDHLQYNKADVLLKISGEKSKDIRLLNTDASKTLHEVVVSKEVPKNSWNKK